MNALRTTLILGAFWLLVFLAGTYQVHFRMSDKQKDLQAKEDKVKEELQQNEELVASMSTVQTELENVKNLWIYRRKAIPRHETSHETYNYLDQILARQQSTTLNFDYLAAEVADTLGVRSANYQVSGEAKFVDLYRFIWYIEHLPRYLRINSLQLAQRKLEKTEEEGSADDRQWVQFEMNITALSADREGFDEVQYATEETAPADSYDPFAPPTKPRAVVPANVLGLPNVFESTLRAMTPTQVYLTDQSGDLKVLGLGDEVYLGRLIDIIPDENRAVFDLDQLSPPRQVSLQIKEKK